MSHRDNLLRAARSCLLDKGYAQVTVRDLVASSGANLASISYHFGSKDQLLTRALLDLNAEWGTELFAALGSEETLPDVERWARIISSIEANRPLWFVNFESIGYVEREPEIRALNARGQAESRLALAQAFGGLGADADPAEIHAVGSHYYSLLTGLAVQILTDPAAAPTAEEIVRADSHPRTTATSS
ncbi:MULTISPECIES: TetR/AcrR family transcriptional regulator [Nocardiaceae]|uniref:Helix-turn-helix domain-containing protein n=1 Tax=Rhodococcoides yunnanense TaxID=278209 RepID=A0ABU4BEG2_9NOCA|nr:MULTISPECIES: TetR/AcrR family transcriptional regulator [Rhodococcus]MDI9896270.1 helix-turn-helix domain-containing protein [Rhodococcus sp. IEGM 1381]MDV6262618.1 helix-turn-helix domain-containing protein [Rhodococcus yunnanensis]